MNLDKDCLLDLVLSDPELEGPFYSLSHSTAVQAVAEAMRVLHSAPVCKVEWAVRISVMMSDSAVYIQHLTEVMPKICMYTVCMSQSYLCTYLTFTLNNRSSLMRIYYTYYSGGSIFC